MAAGAEYFAALQSGDADRVRAILSSRCDAIISDALLKATAKALAGSTVIITVLSVGTETASVNVDSTATQGNTGTGTQFRLEAGQWVWDGCP